MAVFYTGRGSGGGVKLPELTNPATAAEIGEGYEAINASGEKMTGTGEMASALSDELTTQDTLIANIMTALEGKSAASGASVDTCTLLMQSYAYAFSATVYRDGVFSSELNTNYDAAYDTVTDVVCGSVVVVITKGNYGVATNLSGITVLYSISGMTGTDGATYNLFVLRVDAANGEIVTVRSN